MNDFEAARTSAQALAYKNIRTFREGFQLDTAGWALQRDDQDFLALITSRKISGRALLSNERVHRAAQFALIDAAGDAYRQNPERQWLWITIAWDRGVTWERAPRMDTMSLRRIVYGHLDRCGLEGTGTIEFDAWKNLTGEPGRRIVAHAHFLGFRGDGRRVKTKDMEKELKSRRALPNSLDAPSVVIKIVKRTPGDFTRRGFYMLKRPAFAKMYRPDGDGERPDTASVGHSKSSIARLVEIQSRLEVGDVLFSIGAGREVADKVRKEVAPEVRGRRNATPAPSRDEVMRHWRRIRLTNGSHLFREPVIITCKEDRARERE